MTGRLLGRQSCFLVCDEIEGLSRMRRTVLAACVVAFGMAAVSAGVVAAFAAVGPSTKTGAQSTAARAASTPTSKTPSSPASGTPDGTDSAVPAPGALGATSGFGLNMAPTPGPVAKVPAPKVTGSVKGELSEDFAKLGLDDPTTEIDERIASACDGGPVAGPVLCQ
jgi:hypothetical protein